MARAMVTAMRVACNKENEGCKAMTTAKRVTGERMATATKRAMATAMMEVSEEEGDGKGGKSDGDGHKEGNGEEDGDGEQRRQPLMWKCCDGE
jgi:hypothetical protein